MKQKPYFYLILGSVFCVMLACMALVVKYIVTPILYVPKFDSATLNYVRQRVHENFRLTHPELKTTESLMLPGVPYAKMDWLQRRRIDRFANLDAVCVTPLVMQEATEAAEWVQPYLGWTERNLQARRIQYISDLSRLGSPPYVDIQMVGKVASNLAWSTPSTADIAMRRQLLETAANAGWALNRQSSIGALLHGLMQLLAVRKELKSLNWSDLDTAQTRADIEALVNLAASAPQLDAWLVFWEQPLLLFSSYSSAMPRPLIPWLHEEEAMSFHWQALDGYHAVAKAIQQPALRTWVNDLAARHAVASSSWWRIGNRLQNAEARNCMLQILASETWFTTQYRLTPAELRPFDPYTVAVMLSQSSLGTNWDDILTRLVVSREYNRLARATLTVRLQQAQTGQWPASLASAAQFTTSETTAMVALQRNPLAPAGLLDWTTAPLHMAWHTTSQTQLRATLWQQALPLQTLAQRSGNNGNPALQHQWEIDSAGQLDFCSSEAFWTSQPLLLAAVADGLRRMPRLVEPESVQVSQLALPVLADATPTSAALAWPDVAGLPPGQQWWSLSDTEARRITDDWDATLGQTYASKATTRGLYGETDFDNQQAGRAVRLRAKLRAPERVLAIWSVGPDGKDDGGAIAYDPTNGTVSRGDLVAFPEHF
jgi:hypothetical protein